MSDHLNRKDLKHDRFVDEMELAYGAMRRNTTRLVLAGVGIIALLAVILGIFAYGRRQEVAAQTLLAEAISTMEKPVSSEPGAPEDAPFKTQDEKIAKAEPLFRQVTDKYGRKDAADIANLYLARIAASRGDLKSAEPKFRDFVDEHSDHLLAGSAQMSLYQIQIGNGKSKEVIADIDKQLASKEPALPKDALLAVLARCHETIGDDAKAKEAYQRIINEYPDSAYAIDAQRKVARPQA